MTDKIDPSLFEWEPEDVPDTDIYESMAERGQPPEVLKDPKDRAAYVKFLETYKPETP